MEPEYNFVSFNHPLPLPLLPCISFFFFLLRTCYSQLLLTMFFSPSLSPSPLAPLPSSTSLFLSTLTYSKILSNTEYAVDNTPLTQPIFSPLDRNIFNYPHITTSLHTLSYNTPSPATNSAPSSTTSPCSSPSSTSPSSTSSSSSRPSSTSPSSTSPASNSPHTPEDQGVDNPYSVAPTYADSSSTNYTSFISCNNTPSSIPQTYSTYSFNSTPSTIPSCNASENNITSIPQTYALNNMNFEEMPIENDDLENILNFVTTDHSDFNL
jgi:hypothetical protein